VSVVAAPPSPYKGLTPFADSAVDALLFFGRARETEVIAANLMASRFTVLYGPTGVGKSSILAAGVTHRLRREPDLRVATVSSWTENPVASILAAAGAEGEFVDGLAAAAGEGELCLILDQFEEFFLYHGAEDGPGTLLVELPELLERLDVRVNVLVSLREDALALLDVFQGRITNPFGNFLRLDHLDRASGRAAILGPVERWNELVPAAERVQVEPELVEAVLDQTSAGRVDLGGEGRGGVGDGDGRIEAPYLQLVMQRLWEEGGPVLRASTLEELGGAEEIVRTNLEHALDALDPSEKDVAATVFKYLVTPSGTKIAHRAGDLAEYAEVEEASLVPVLESLGRQRILRTVDGAVDGSPRYEIFHDVLATPVLAWRGRRALERQRTEAERRQRRLVAIAAAALLALAVVAATAVYALTQRSHAQAQAREARARELEATARAQLATDPQQSLAAALQAARLEPGPSAEDVLRTALIASRLRDVLPQGAPVVTAAYSASGRRLLVAAGNGRVRVYDEPGERLVRTLRTRAPLTAAAFAPDGRTIVTGSTGGARLWPSGASLRVRGTVTSATFGDGGRLVLVTGTGGSAAVWRAAAGSLVHDLPGTGRVFNGVLDPHGRVAATVAQDAAGHVQARLYDVASGRLLRVLPQLGVTDVAFSPDGSLVATASRNGTTALWHVRTGERFHLLDDGGSAANAVAFSPDGKLLATAVADGGVRVWTVADGTRLYFLTGHTNPVLSVAWSRDGSELADASADGTSRLWKIEGIEKGELVSILAGHRAPVTGVVFSPDGRRLTTSSADGTARVWDAQADQVLRLLGRHPGAVETASFDPSGARVVSAGRDGTARIWDVRRRRAPLVLRQRAAVTDASFSPDGRLVVTAGANRAAILWGAVTGKQLRVLHHVYPVTVARFSPDGTLVATGSSNGTVVLWNVSDGRQLMRVRNNAPVTDLAFSADGQLLAFAAGSRAAIWSVAERRLKHSMRIRGHVSRLAFSPDGKLLATAGGDGTARLWDTGDGRLVHTLPTGTHGLTDVVFSHDGQLLLTTSVDRDIRLWDVASGRLVRSLVGAFGTVPTGAFSPDDRWIVTAGPISAILWKTSSGQLLFYLRGHRKLLTSVSFAPDGHHVLSSSEDGTVRLYDCTVCAPLDGLESTAERRLRAG
jgi:WD40 repeat protein